ncbi:MAG: 50S ribosomal protein L5 [Verrucomicrobiales bacterium]|jgi:large subunit ribosomal protein L5|nr:50S ribosomal protein L5 [Verrucomicrobiales bacterium]
MTSDLLQEYRDKVVPALMSQRGYKNVNQVPKLSKIVVNCSVGSANDVKAAMEDAVHDVTLITGQKPIRTKSTKSISNFKLRENQEIGVKVTLRGKHMYEFLFRLAGTALPRIRDFRGISTRAFDGRGAYTLGVKDHTIFPEIELDKIKRNLGMDVTIVTTGKNKEETKALLTLMGLPFADRKH